MPGETGAALGLVEELNQHLRVPVVAEGRIWTPEQACLALKKEPCSYRGGAISQPHMITRRFAEAMEQCMEGIKTVERDEMASIGYC